jgi:hypothetical protein
MRTSWRKLVAVIGIAALLQACAFPSGTIYAPCCLPQVSRARPRGALIRVNDRVSLTPSLPGQVARRGFAAVLPGRRRAR